MVPLRVVFKIFFVNDAGLFIRLFFMKTSCLFQGFSIITFINGIAFFDVDLDSLKLFFCLIRKFSLIMGVQVCG